MRKTFLLMLITLNLHAFAHAQVRRVRRPTPAGVIKTGTTLVKNQRYYSENKRYALVCQADGNLVLYKFSAPEKYGPIWGTRTEGTPKASCIFQTDGNLVVYYNHGQQAMWNSRKNAKSAEDKSKSWLDYIPPYGIDSTSKGSSATASDYWLYVQNDGNLVIYAGAFPNGNAIWTSNTFEKN